MSVQLHSTNAIQLILGNLIYLICNMDVHQLGLPTKDESSLTSFQHSISLLRGQNIGLLMHIIPR